MTSHRFMFDKHLTFFFLNYWILESFSAPPLPIFSPFFYYFHLRLQFQDHVDFIFMVGIVEHESNQRRQELYSSLQTCRHSNSRSFFFFVMAIICMTHIRHSVACGPPEDSFEVIFRPLFTLPSILPQAFLFFVCFYFFTCKTSRLPLPIHGTRIRNKCYIIITRIYAMIYSWDLSHFVK